MRTGRLEEGGGISRRVRPLCLSRFRSPRGATSALLDAIITSTTVESFHQALLECADPRSSPVTCGNALASEEQHRSWARTTARFSDVGITEEAVMRSTCASCGAQWNKRPEEIFKPCPCMLVAYCSPECQKMHWKTHKPACVAARKGD